MENYFEQAVSCVKDYVLPMQRQVYEKCAGDFDRIYGEAMNRNLYTGKVIEPGNIYELGYHKCTCPKVLSGTASDPEVYSPGDMQSPFMSAASGCQFVSPKKITSTKRPRSFRL